MAFTKKTRDELQGIVSGAIADAKAFIESEIAPDRIKAQRYYDGECDLSYEAGRNKIIVTRVRDVVRAVKPSLMRVFMSTARPVEFVPSTPDDVATEEQATQFVQTEFERKNGFGLLNDVFQDSLVKKTGFAKAYWEKKEVAKGYTFSNLTDDEFAVIAGDDNVTVIEHGEEPSPDGLGMVHSLKITRTEKKGDLEIESVPPEEMIWDRGATSIDDAYVIAHRREMRVGDLIAMGYKAKDVEGLGVADGGDEEEYERTGYSQDADDAKDDAMREVTVTEAYMRVDVDGTGIPALHRFLCAGGADKILDFEAVDEVPFAVFEADPEPHSFSGHSLADLVLNDQDAATALMRSILDNASLVNTPRREVLESAIVNMDDVLNNEIGAIVRVRQPGAVTELVTPFVAGQTLQALGYLDEMTQSKTGVSRASMGLDANALQNTTRVQAQATVQAGAASTEAMVRNLAMGLRQLFALMRRIYKKHSDEPRLMRMAGSQFVAVDPRVWSDDSVMTTNVGLGTGREEEKMQALQMALNLQMQAMQAYGPSNGIVGLTHIRNTIADMLAINGVRNSERYFAPMSAETEAQMRQQQAQAALGQQAADPNAAFLQAEQMKAQAKGQSDMMRMQLDAQKAQMDDDRQRDKMAQDFALQNAKLQAEHGLKVDEMALKAEQNAQRQPFGSF